MNAPVLIGDIVDADVRKLREIADYFDQRGNKSNGDLMRAVASRHEVLFGAYWTATSRSEVKP